MQNLVSKLPPSPSVFTKSKIASYYDNIKFRYLNLETSEKILNILKGLNLPKDMFIKMDYQIGFEKKC